mmetsp:Transcript_6168/g.9955  ORF Transcript_6168/g.9955 Transcript_6168/m.9955 type:complete len:88 (-) Transcript_6168:430-693(-)
MHRDIKPSNILINEQFRVKLCDFGLARMASSKIDNLSNTNNKRLSQHVVTRFYRPPEVILLEEYSSKIDIWSAGCVIAELVKASDSY